MNKLYAFLPCYNEEMNIGNLIDEWIQQRDDLAKLGYELQVRAIDDCSKDNTKGVILSKQIQYEGMVELIAHDVNKNLCGGLNTSIEYFMKYGAENDLMSLMDGDNTHNPKYIIPMIEKLVSGKKDCVIASRYCSDSGVIGVAAHREFLSDMAKIYYSAMLKVPGVKDYTCGYRVYSYSCIKQMVEKFGKDPIKETSFACMMEFLYKIYLAGGTFDEVGFELRYDNKQGESKMRVFTTMRKSLSTALKLSLMKKKDLNF